MIGSDRLRRVLILGHSGFIGSALRKRLEKSFPVLEVVGRSNPPFDLSRGKDAASLAEFFEPGTAIVVLSALKRQAGDTLENYLKNESMAVNLCRCLADRFCGRFIYFSSAAVYGEDVHNTNITEETPVRPRSYYGMAKFSSERLLRKAFEDRGGRGLAILRPATVYGPGEPGEGYTPTGFLRKAVRGDGLTLWGDGSELREFIYIDDLTEIVERMIFGDFEGVLNVVSGRSYSFKEAIGIIARIVGSQLVPVEKPRSKDQVDNVFCGAALKRLFPDFEFTTLEEGLRRIYAAQSGPNP